MPTADGDVIEEDVAVGVAAGRRHGLVEQEPRSRVGTAFDDGESRPLREAFDARYRGFRARLGRRVQFVEEVRAKNGGRFHGDIFRRLVVVLVGHPLLLLAALAASATVFLRIPKPTCALPLKPYPADLLMGIAHFVPGSAAPRGKIRRGTL